MNSILSLCNGKIRFQTTVRKTSTKVITPTNQNRGKQRDEPIGIPTRLSNLRKTQEESRVQVAIGFAFA